MTYTDTEKYQALVRELKMRQQSYPRRIQQRLMSQGEAKFQIAIMEEIVADYAAKIAKERLL